MANASPTPSQPTSPAAASRPPHGPGIPLEAILESKTNPRKSVNPQAELELAESVRVHGVLQPVLLRPLPGSAAGFELVVGSRRLRAARAAGLKHIPANIRDLTDEQAMEIQIVENLQREDVAPIDEGRGYIQLIAALAKKDPKRAADGQGVKRQDLVAEVARLVGKSPRYVYARMKLCELIPELQKDLEEGRIEASHADELVRLTPKDQKDVRAGGLFLEEREQGMDDEEYVPAWKEKTGLRAISVRNLKVVIERDYQLTLDKAKFPTASAALQPLPCTECPKNTAVNALLPPAAKATCTDKECWRNKMRQWVESQARELAKKAPNKELVQVTLAHYAHAGRNGAKINARPDWKSAKPGECKNVQPAVQVDDAGGVVHYTSAKTVCTNKQCKTHFGAPARTSSSAGSGSSSSAKKLTLEELRERHAEALEGFIDERVPVEFLRRVLAKVEKLGEPEMRLLADSLGAAGCFDQRDLAIILGGEKPVVSEMLAKEAKAADLPRAVLALAFSNKLDDNLGMRFGAYAKARGVDGAKIGSELRAGIKACAICGCFDQHGCDLGGGKRCAWVQDNAVVKSHFKGHLCNNPLCVAEGSRPSRSTPKAASAKKPGPKVPKKPVQASAKPAKKAAARKKGGRR